jgi:hypothetical protein
METRWRCPPIYASEATNCAESNAALRHRENRAKLRINLPPSNAIFGHDAAMPTYCSHNGRRFGRDTIVIEDMPILLSCLHGNNIDHPAQLTILASQTHGPSRHRQKMTITKHW